MKKQSILKTSVFLVTLAALLGLLVFSVLASVTFGHADLSIRAVYRVIV